MSDEVFVKCENISKKFCRSLKRSLWYGVQDICSEINPRRGMRNIVGSEQTLKLRKNEFWAVNDVSFELKRGECVGLIGQNGAGKSTLLKLLNGLIKPDHGKITMKGRIGALIELNAGFNPILTGRENVYIYGSILGFTKKEIDRKYDNIVEFAELAEFMEMPFRSYSSGMKVRLGFAVASQMEPDVLIIDEVLAVGDLGFTIKCVNKIKRLIQRSAVIFVSHNMQQISNICTKVMLLTNGENECFTTDVGKGIDYYFEQLKSPAENIVTNSDIKISEVYLQNGNKRVNGKEKLAINYCDDLTIEMNLRMLNTSINKIAIRVMIWDMQLRCAADCFSEFCDFTIEPKKNSSIKLTLKNVNFNMGNYSVTVAVLNLATKEMLVRYDNAAHFQVACLYTSWASVNLIGEWRQD